MTLPLLFWLHVTQAAFSSVGEPKRQGSSVCSFQFISIQKAAQNKCFTFRLSGDSLHLRPLREVGRECPQVKEKKEQQLKGGNTA